MKIVAKIFSYIFHPLILPSVTLLIIYFAARPLFAAYSEADIRQLFLIVIGNTFFFPVVAILLMLGLKLIKTVRMETREERIVPFITSGTFYLWAYVVVERSSFPTIISHMLLGACITLFAVFFVNLFFKVSIHTASFSCLMVIMLYVCLAYNPGASPVLLLIILLAGIIGSSRMLLDAHQPPEIFAGYFIGFISQMIAISYF